MEPFARVLAEPGSTAARRVLELAWRANGNAQAELIEKQLAYRELEAARKTNTAAARAIMAAIEHLLVRNGKAWAGRVAELVDDYRFRRGLVAQVRMSSAAFLAHAAELFALAPIQHLSLEGPLDVGALAESPHLGKLASLAIERRADFGDREAARLAGSRHASNLCWISLSGNQIGAAGLEALAASPHLKRVVFLSLEQNPGNPTPAIAAELARGHGACAWLASRPDGPPDRDDVCVTA